MDWKKLAERMKLVPHLKLDINVPLYDILQELNSHVDEYTLINLNLPLRNEMGKERPWYGRGLIDYLPDSRKLFEYRALNPEHIKRDSWGDVIVSHTDLTPLLPKTLSFVHSIIENPRVTRLLKLPPGGVLPWHSHCQNPFIGITEYRKMVVQIPLVTNDEVIYRVRPFSSPDAKTQDLSYKAGEVRILNAWEEHQVENRSTQDRIALYIEAPLTDARFFGHVLSALDA